MKDYIVSERVELRRNGWVTTIEVASGVCAAALGTTQDESRDNALACLQLEREDEDV